jgi:hypothetical protein
MYSRYSFVSILPAVYTIQEACGSGKWGCARKVSTFVGCGGAGVGGCGVDEVCGNVGKFLANQENGDVQGRFQRLWGVEEQGVGGKVMMNE